MSSSPNWAARLNGSAEPSVADGREGEYGFAKPESLVVLIYVTDAASKRRLGWVGPLGNLHGDGAGGVGQHTDHSGLARPGFDRPQELVPPAGAVHGHQTRSFPSLLRR